MNILHRLDDVAKLQRGEMVRPEFVDLHTSNLCNMDCLGCAYRGQLSRDYMPEARHFEAVDQFIDFGVKAFDFAGGGEPTCLPYLPRLMRHIADRGAHFALITNGLLMNAELREVLLQHGTYCRVSLEASNREDYRRYKRTDGWVWDRVNANIRQLVDERNKRKSDLEISVRFSVGKSLRGDKHYRDIAALIRGLGVDRATVKALRHEPEELATGDAGYEKMLAEHVLHSVPEARVWIAPVPFADVPQCYLNPLHAMMDWRGNLYLCCFFYYRENDHYIGNIFDTPLADLWLSDVHRAKIAGIERKECARVDCKFVLHDLAVKKALKRGAGYWL